MNGIVYLLENRQIILIVPDVVSYTETDIIGKDSSVKGIDLAEASFCIVEESDFKEGDTLSTKTVDQRDLITDPDSELAEAISTATTLEELKAALIGSGKPARVKGKLK